MGMALYRKYRPRNLSEVIGQKPIVDSLLASIKDGSFSHAYLLTGPRGIGKTSVARILAHEINNLSYDDDRVNLDIIEIDAASNRRIDDIRELREKVNIAPSFAKYKVYIIDEVHMLTPESFNALLKTLEEPPKHVIFIMATTEVHKLPITILSRTQRYTFKPVNEPEVAKYLRTIADKEKINIGDKALSYIARHGEGSLRDSISLLDQLSNRSNKAKINESDVEEIIGAPSKLLVDSLMNAIENNDIEKAISTLSEVRDGGVKAATMSSYLAEEIRNCLLAKNLKILPSVALSLLEDLLETAASNNPDRYLELAILKVFYSVDNKLSSIDHKTTTMMTSVGNSGATVISEASIKRGGGTRSGDKVVSGKKNIDKERPASRSSDDVPLTPVESDINHIDEQAWQKVLAELKKEHNTLYGVARMAKLLESSESSLTLGFKFAFHKQRIAEAKNNALIKNTIEVVTGLKLKIDCILDKSIEVERIESIKSNLGSVTPDTMVANIDDSSQDDKPALENISNIFGGAEVLES